MRLWSEFAFRSGKAKPFSADAEKGQRLLSAQAEDHVNGGLHLDWLVVEQVGLVAPRFHSIHGGLLQHRGPADDTQVLDGPGLGYGRLQHDRARTTRGLGDRRI